MTKKHDQGLLNELIEILSCSDQKPIENLSVLFMGKSVHCFLCNRELEIRLSKKNRPYLTCDSCQVQIFVRGSKGIERLARLIQKQAEKQQQIL